MATAIKKASILSNEKFCVYLHGWNDGCRDDGIGDGITAPSRRCVAITQTEEEAESIMARINARHARIPLVPGNRNRRALLAIAKYNPLDFVGRQDRDVWSMKARFASLCGQCREEAAKTFADLMA